MALLCIAITVYLQSLCISSLSLGNVTGSNLRDAGRRHLPGLLSVNPYDMTETTTRIPEVILEAGCGISILVVLLISLLRILDNLKKGLRVPKIFAVALALGDVI
jgi:hypothetical protein